MKRSTATGKNRKLVVIIFVENLLSLYCHNLCKQKEFVYGLKITH